MWKLIYIYKPSYLRHKILGYLIDAYQPYTLGLKDQERCLTREQLQKMNVLFSKKIVDRQVLFLEASKDIDKIIFNSGKPASYRMNDKSITKYEDKTYLKSGIRWIFMKENLKFLYGVITGVTTVQLIRWLIIILPNFIHK